MQALTDQLKLLISQQYTTTGIDINYLTEGSILDTNQHDVARGVSPILKKDLLLEIIAFLYVTVDLVEHVLIILDALEVAGED